ncbi:MAG: hypothetical protein ACK2U3_04385 [Anaerolineales bacterium]|jgi:hypothetical protein
MLNLGLWSWLPHARPPLPRERLRARLRREFGLHMDCVTAAGQHQTNIDQSMVTGFPHYAPRVRATGAP